MSQLRFAAFLQAAAAVMFGVAFILRLFYSGLDAVTAVLLIAAVACGSFFVLLRKKMAEQSES